jgi:hypothetical protein
MRKHSPAKYKLIGCKVLMRELYGLAYTCDNVIDILWKKQELHNTPDILRQQVQSAIDAVESEEEPYDAILLGYCLCSNGIVGLKSSKTPLVIPRGHDCVTLLLGSKERYKTIFDSFGGGIYWYSPGWIEHTLMPGRQRYETIYREYEEKYGQDNAKYLMEMEQGWLNEYKCAVYVDWAQQHRQDCEEYARSSADFLNWEYRLETGDSRLMQDLLDGNWDEERFLIVQPGQSVQPSFDDRIIRT